MASPSVRDSFIRYTSPVYPGASSILVPLAVGLLETTRAILYSVGAASRMRSPRQPTISRATTSAAMAAPAG